MKRGKKVTSVLLCIIILSTFGCSSGKQKSTSSDYINNNLGNQSKVISVARNFQSDQTGSTGNAESTVDISSLKLSNSSYELIDDLLKKQKEVSQISWSSDKYYVAFSIGNMGWDDQMYLWEIGESEPVEIKDVKDRICGFSWSPDNNYVFADTGSSVQRGGYIVDAQNKKKTGELGYVGNAFWSPDSKWLAVGEISDIQPSVAIELTGTVDMCIYNVATKEKKIIAQGTADYYFNPKEWNGNGILTYVKTDFKNPDKQEVITYGSANVDEITYVNEKYSFSLAFPAYWQDQYTVEDVQGVGIRIHHKPTWLKNGGGTLFQITVFDKSIDGWKDQYDGLDNAVGLKKIYEDNKVVIGFSTPTDVQYITDDKILYREYMKMENDVKKIAETFKKLKNSNQNTEDAISILYHKYFDLNDTKKSELRERGYSEEQIANLDNEDFENLELNWKLTDKQIFDIKNIYPELRNVDISKWTNQDFNNYSVVQDNKNYAPTSKQEEQLNTKGISLDIARKMLKEYQTYDNLLSQSDGVLNELKNQIIDADKQYDDFVKYKAEIRAKYKENLERSQQ